MDAPLDYTLPADLFPNRRYAKSLGRYRRFASAAEAIRYVVEEMPAACLVGSALDVDGSRYEGNAIRVIYDAEAYPLKRALAA